MGASQLESSPHSPQLEKAHVQQQRPRAAKKKKKKIKNKLGAGEVNRQGRNPS